MGNYITPVPPVLSAPVRRDRVVTEIQTTLSTYVSWLTSFGTAYRLVNTDDKGIFVPDVYESPTSYHRPTPNPSIPGQSFIVLEDTFYGTNESYATHGQNYMNYTLGVIVSFNLEKIDASKYPGYRFDEELKRDVLEVLNTKLNFSWELSQETSDPDTVWDGFEFQHNLWHKAPMGAFKLFLNINQLEDCASNDYTNALQNLTASEKEIVVQSMTAEQIQAAMTAQQITDLSTLICP